MNMKNIQFGVVCMALCSALTVLPLEAVVLRSPADGEAVCLTTPGRQAFLRMSHGERRAAFTNLTWRKWAAKEIRSKPAPVVLRWEGVVPADGFRVSVVRTGQATPWFDERVTNCEATVWNLEIARDYAWTVSDGREEKTGHFRRVLRHTGFLFRVQAPKPACSVCTKTLRDSSLTLPEYRLPKATRNLKAALLTTATLQCLKNTGTL